MADPPAIDFLFARSPSGPEDDLSGCYADGATFACSYLVEGGALVYRIEGGSSGYRVVAVTELGD